MFQLTYLTILCFYASGILWTAIPQLRPESQGLKRWKQQHLDNFAYTFDVLNVSSRFLFPDSPWCSTFLLTWSSSSSSAVDAPGNNSEVGHYVNDYHERRPSSQRWDRTLTKIRRAWKSAETEWTKLNSFTFGRRSKQLWVCVDPAGAGLWWADPRQRTIT